MQFRRSSLAPQYCQLRPLGALPAPVDARAPLLVSLVTVAKAVHAGVRKGGGSARGPEDRPRSAAAVSAGRLSRAGAEDRTGAKRETEPGPCED